jgi:hypothetical protein
MQFPQTTALRTPALTVLFFALAATSTFAAIIPSYLAPITQTVSPFLGITHYQIVQSLGSPLPYVLPTELAIHIVEIDVDAPGISFLGTPGNGAAANEYTRQTTGSFVNTYDLAVGINGDFYSTDTGITANVNGLGMSNGAIVSPAAAGDDRDNSLVISQTNLASIISTPTVPVGAWNAVSGNQLLLRNGLNVTPGGSYTTTLNPHTAVGVDAQTGNVFFMVVDGRQTDFSEGMRTDVMANMLLDFGVDDAINLDGGGSSTLVFADGPGGSARTVNSPSDNATSQFPGTQRSVANHFGVYGIPNPAYVPLSTPPRPPAPNTDPFLTQLTILDGFNGNEGHFTSNPFGGSGSTNGITNASTAVFTTAEAHLGDGSQQVTLARTADASSRVRHLSGGGTPANNRVNVGGVLSAMGPFGFVGFFLKTTEVDLQVYLGIDDGAAAGTNGLERSTALSVIADGEWHLYEWDLANANLWTNFANGNGTIDGPNAYIDSIFFQSGASTVGDTFTFFLDTVAYNPYGSLSILAVPEPATLTLLCPLAFLAIRRRRCSRCRIECN